MSAEDLTPNKDGGILKEILTQGSGDEHAMNGDTVYVHYTGTLLDGTKFDSSRDRGEKFSFEIGKGSVIKGWDIGMLTMKRGELAKFTLKPEYAYGANGSPPTIPPNATLVFEVEMFDFEGEDISEKSDKSIIKRIMKSGTGFNNPNDGARCMINLKGMDSTGRVFDERNELEFNIGEGFSLNIVQGIEHALTKFKVEEKAKLVLKPSAAWGETGMKEWNIPADATVTYEVELKRFEKAKESWEMDPKEKLEKAELLKNKGTEAFKASKFKDAIKKYEKVNEILAPEDYSDEKEKEQAKKLQTIANLNSSLCYIKIKEFREAVSAADRALEFEPTNEKGLFRMAQAYFGLLEYDSAIKTYQKVLDVNPENKDATNQINFCKLQIKKSYEKEKSMYTKMFAT